MIVRDMLNKDFNTFRYSETGGMREITSSTCNFVKKKFNQLRKDMAYFTGIQSSEELDTMVRQLRESLNLDTGNVEQQRGLRMQSHITLAHLGKQRPDTDHYQDIGESHEAFEIELAGVSIFRNPKTTHLVLPVTLGMSNMKLLEASLRKESRQAGRTYNAHMTVGSCPTEWGGVGLDNYELMANFREKYAQKTWGRMVVSQFQLFSSTQGVCRVMDRWRLTGLTGVM